MHYTRKGHSLQLGSVHNPARLFSSALAKTLVNRGLNARRTVYVWRVYPRRRGRSPSDTMEVYEPLIQEHTSSTVQDDNGLKVWLRLEVSILLRKSGHMQPRTSTRSSASLRPRRSSRLPKNACECVYYASTRVLSRSKRSPPKTDPRIENGKMAVIDPPLP